MKEIFLMVLCIALNESISFAQTLTRTRELAPKPKKEALQLVLRGKVSNNGNGFNFFYQDQFDDLVNLHQHKKIDGVYYISLTGHRPILLYHGTGMTFWPVFAMPGDTITLEMNKNKEGYTYTSTRYGKSANILNMVNERYGNLGITSPLFNPKINFHYYDSVYDQLLANENNLIDSLCRAYKTDGAYKKYLKKEIFYLDIERKLEPYYYAKKYDLDVIPKWYVTKLASLKKWINKDDNINLKYYRFFCYWYNIFLLRDSLYSPIFPQAAML